MEEIINEHFKIFNKYPNIIGVFWSDRDILKQKINKAIKDNKPYNEYDLLSDEEKKAFNSGNLVF